MRLATRIWLAQGAAAAPPAVYDPSVDVADLWVGAPFASSPWAAIASAGTSATTGALTEATNPPGVRSIGGLDGADFIDAADILSNANAISSIISAAAYSFEVVFLADTAAVFVPGAGYTIPAFLTDDTNGFVFFSFGDGGVHCGHYDGTDFSGATQACGTGSIHTAQAWFDGANVYVSVDGAAPASAAKGNVTSGGGAGAIRVGQNYSGAAPFDGVIAELRAAAVDHGATARAGWLSYVNDKYGTSF